MAIDLGSSIRRRRSRGRGARGGAEPGRGSSPDEASASAPRKAGRGGALAAKWRGWAERRRSGKPRRPQSEGRPSGAGRRARGRPSGAGGAPGAGRPHGADDPRGSGRPRGKRRTLLFALIVAGCGLGSGHLVATTFFFRPPAAPPDLQGVPDVRGHPLVLARALLADSGLATSRVDSVYHPAAARGIVIGQSPLPGRTALPRASVRVTVSLGPDVRPVPDVTRLPGSRAAALLGASGFVVAVDTVESTAPAGRVIQLEPGPGTPVAMPGSVRVAVSLGPPTMPMPTLAGMDEHAAVDLLGSLGLVVSEIEYRYSLLNVDVVFGQHPGPNAEVEQGAEIRLIVGRAVRPPLDAIFRRSSSAAGRRGAA